MQFVPFQRHPAEQLGGDWNAMGASLAVSGAPDGAFLHKGCASPASP